MVVRRVNITTNQKKKRISKFFPIILAAIAVGLGGCSTFENLTLRNAADKISDKVADDTAKRIGVKPKKKYEIPKDAITVETWPTYSLPDKYNIKAPCEPIEQMINYPKLRCETTVPQKKNQSSFVDKDGRRILVEPEGDIKFVYHLEWMSTKQYGLVSPHQIKDAWCEPSWLDEKERTAYWVCSLESIRDIKELKKNFPGYFETNVIVARVRQSLDRWKDEGSPPGGFAHSKEDWVKFQGKVKEYFIDYSQDFGKKKAEELFNYYGWDKFFPGFIKSFIDKEPSTRSPKQCEVEANSRADEILRQRNIIKESVPAAQYESERKRVIKDALDDCLRENRYYTEADKIRSGKKVELEYKEKERRSFADWIKYASKVAKKHKFRVGGSFVSAVVENVFLDRDEIRLKVKGGLLASGKADPYVKAIELRYQWFGKTGGEYIFANLRIAGLHQREKYVGAELKIKHFYITDVMNFVGYPIDLIFNGFQDKIVGRPR